MENNNKFTKNGMRKMIMEEKDKDRSKRIVEYDFRKTKEITQDKISSLQAIFDAFSQKIASSLSTKLASTVQTQLLEVNQSSYAEFVRTIQIPTLLGIIDMTPLKGMALIEINPNIIFNFIDRLLGGRGEIVSLTRDLTDIELEVIKGVVADFVVDLKNAWANVIEISPELKRIETNPQFAQITSPREKVVIGTIEIKLGETKGNMCLCLPLIVIEPAMERFTGEGKALSTSKTMQFVSSEDRIKMQRAIENVTVCLVVELGRTEVTMRDILELKKGDVIRLKSKVENELIMYANGIPKFKCRPGVIGNRMATQIVKRIGE